MTVRHDVVYGCSSCGVSVTVGGTPNGDEAYAEKEASRCLRKLCRCVGVASHKKRLVPAEWSYAPNHR